MKTNHSPTEFLRVASATLQHYGFVPVDDIEENPDVASLEIPLPITDRTSQFLGESATRMLASGVHTATTPQLVYHIDTSKDNATAISFHIYHVEKSIAEALLLEVAKAVTKDLTGQSAIIRINSLGDTESITRYSRELTNFLRKRLDAMPVSSREHMKTHALFALQDLIEQDHELSYKSPNPLEYLSDQSRKHFRDIIEYLDMTATPYEIDARMLGHHDYYTDALFAVTTESDGDGSPVELRGGRYTTFLERATKRKVHGVGATLVLHDRPAPQRLPRPIRAVPNIAIVQLGFGPKVRSLVLIDELRQAGISIRHDLTTESLSTQLRNAENHSVPFVVIIGQKEYVDNTAIVRDMHARKQEAVPMNQLLRRLQKVAA